VRCAGVYRDSLPDGVRDLGMADIVVRARKSTTEGDDVAAVQVVDTPGYQVVGGVDAAEHVVHHRYVGARTPWMPMPPYFGSSSTP
jgi:hypothetical protein